MIRLHTPTKLAGAALAALIAFASLGLPAFAREFVQDGAGLFNAATVSRLNAKIGDFNRQTGKEVVVVTVPSLSGETPQAVAEKAFAQQQVNGVMIFLAKAEKKDGIIGDRASRAFFPNGSFDSVRQAMRGYFRTGNFDEGITTGVDLVINDYRGHERSLGGAQRQRQLAPASSSSSFGGGMSLIWLVLILIAGFLIIRAIFRAMSGPRQVPPGYGGQPGYGQGPGYGGMGGGMMGGGGGGGFFSGLLGGLGGAFIGNELFGRHEGGIGGEQAGFIGGEGGQQADAGGWQSDAGQADTGGASFGDYGSSGGGFDGGGGGGFDGGGGGDSGGGW
ncbi:MAG: hypothetical protein NVS3B16_10120 [Vulcanimicrobiaceae bacterium]